MSILRLAIPSPLRRLFDYLPPETASDGECDSLAPGTRILVPFGKREVTGYLVQCLSHSDLPEKQLKRAVAILDPSTLVAPPLLALCQWAATYYHHPPGEVYTVLFPKRLRTGLPRQLPGPRAWRLTHRGMGLPNGALSRSPRQAQALALLQQQREPVAEATLAEEGVSTAVMRSLLEKSLVERCNGILAPKQAGSEPGLALNTEQQAVMQALRSTGQGFSCHLLDGVTGSGKTEVYLQLIADCLHHGQQALVLIPEIGLTPQTLTRFEQRFDAQIVVFHSGLSEAQRYRAWELAHAGAAHIVIGTRSAVFTPLPNLGLIIVDEEHDGSYKQQDGFRYSARDVAVKRGQLEDCPVLLGSATPSLESLHNALSGRYQHHRLTARAGSSPLPGIDIIDIRKQHLHAGFSEVLLKAIEDTLHAGEQALLFLNRRGYAPTLRCHDCGWLGECRACDARLTVHRSQRRLRCHHCGASQALPSRCPNCHSVQLTTQGVGTEQAEDFLRGRFPQWPIYRVDSDSMQNRDAMARLAAELDRGKPGVLLGTQMLTKGHHFPTVTLVAVIDTDTSLFSADFRGEERMAQLLTQVAGRAGRADRPGRVLLQTHYPDHPLVQSMVSQSYAAQAKHFLAERRASGLPPLGQLAVIRADCSDVLYTEQFLRELRESVQERLPAGSSLVGPLPSPLQRRAGRFRFQLLLSAQDRRSTQLAAGLIVAAAEAGSARKGLKWSIDIDPLDLY